jgi:hypothetical protein
MIESRSDRLKQAKEQLARQHGPLLSALRGLESMLEPSPPAQGDLERRLNRVADTLETHIKEEEAGDLFGWIPETFDEVKEELDALRKEHPSLVKTLRQLAVDTRGAETVLTSTDLSVRIRSLVADIRQHEAQESVVLQAISAA